MQPFQPNHDVIGSCSQSNTTGLIPSDLVDLQEQSRRNIQPVLAELLCSEPPLSDEDEELMLSIESIDLKAGQGLKEDGGNAPKSYCDPALIHHPNIMDRMKEMEADALKQKYDYLNGDGEIRPYMRKIVASWMLEVCEEQNCEEAVFPLAIAILDRLLFICKLKKEHLQLVACVCLLLSSKSRQCSHFSLELLSWYTDRSVSMETMRSWELMILSHIRWDVNIVTPIDFVDLLLVRSLGEKCHLSKDTQLARRHAITFIALCCTESHFVKLSPSLIAASAIYAALRGIHRSTPEIAQKLAVNSWKSVNQLNSITSLVESVVSKEISAMKQTMETPVGGAGNKSSNSTMQQQCSQGKFICGQSTSGGQNTPIDVQDIIV